MTSKVSEAVERLTKWECRPADDRDDLRILLASHKRMREALDALVDGTKNKDMVTWVRLVKAGRAALSDEVTL